MMMTMMMDDDDDQERKLPTHSIPYYLPSEE